MTTFVDRAVELARARDVLSRSRLLTLVGDEGSGKSRMAGELARAEANRESGRESERVHVVDLANVGSDALVASAIAHALGVNQARPRVIEALAEQLREAEFLLVLDGGEGVRHGCAGTIERLLAGCPRLRFLVTTRDPLRVLGETVLHVAGLEVPPPGRAPIGDLLRVPSVRLFVDRALAAQPDFVPGDDEGALVADVCRRLDGIPLAIELVACRTRTSSLTDVVTSIAERFPAERSAQTSVGDIVRAAIAWAIDTLPPDEQLVLRRVSLLADFDLDAAVAACGGELGAEQVGAALGQLVLHRLVVFDAAASRFRLLEAIRDRACAALDDAGELGATEAAVLDHFTALVTEAHPHLLAPDQREWLDRLEREHDNIRRCVQLLLAERHDPRGARLVSLLWRYWYVRGHLLEGRLWLRLALGVLESGGERDDDLVALCLHGAGTLAWAQGDYEGARLALDESLALRRRLGRPDGLADSLNNRGTLAVYEGDYGLARSYLEESLQLAEEAGVSHNVARAYTNLGYVARLRGDFDAADGLLAEAYRLLHDEGDIRSLTIVLSNIGAVRLAQDRPADAHAALEEGLRYAREVSAPESAAVLLSGLSTVALAEGRLDEARRAAEESLATSEQLGQRRLRADGLWRYALVELAERHFERAAALVDEAILLTDDPHLRASGLVARARAAVGLGDRAAAVDAARESLRIRRKLGDAAGEVESAALLAELLGEADAVEDVDAEPPAPA